MRLLLLSCILLVGHFAFAQNAYTVESLPDPKKSAPYGYVSNPDHVLDAGTVDNINTILGSLEDSTSVQVAVAVVNSIGDAVPREFATELFRYWGIGQAENNNGLLILLVMDQRRMEFEVGYGLEGILTDGICKRIQVEYMVPRAKEGDYNAAVTDGVTEVSRILLNPNYRQEVYAGTADSVARPFFRRNIFLPFVYFVCFVYVTVLIIAWNTSAKNIKKKPIYVQHFFNPGYNNIKNSLIGVALPAAFLGSQIAAGNLRILEFWLFVYLFATVLLVEKRFRLNSYIIRETDKLPDEPYKTYNYLSRSHSKGWLATVFLFPLPFLLYWIWHRVQMRRLRNTPPIDAFSGLPMHKLSEKADNAFLEAFQLAEEKLKSVDYDVWKSDVNDNIEIIRYENFYSKYKTCANCGGKTFSLEKNEIVQSATYTSSGLGKKIYSCKHCAHREEKTYTIPKKVASSSSSSGGGGGSSWGGGSSGGGGGGSSWGGGSSGGGGAGSGW